MPAITLADARLLDPIALTRHKLDSLTRRRTSVNTPFTDDPYPKQGLITSRSRNRPLGIWLRDRRDSIGELTPLKDKLLLHCHSKFDRSVLQEVLGDKLIVATGLRFEPGVGKHRTIKLVVPTANDVLMLPGFEGFRTPVRMTLVDMPSVEVFGRSFPAVSQSGLDVLVHERWRVAGEIYRHLSRAYPYTFGNVSLRWTAEKFLLTADSTVVAIAHNVASRETVWVIIDRALGSTNGRVASFTSQQSMTQAYETMATTFDTSMQYLNLNNLNNLGVQQNVRQRDRNVPF